MRMRWAALIFLPESDRSGGHERPSKIPLFRNRPHGRSSYQAFAPSAFFRAASAAQGGGTRPRGGRRWTGFRGGGGRLASRRWACDKPRRRSPADQNRGGWRRTEPGPAWSITAGAGWIFAVTFKFAVGWRHLIADVKSRAPSSSPIPTFGPRGCVLCGSRTYGPPCFLAVRAGTSGCFEWVLRRWINVPGGRYSNVPRRSIFLIAPYYIHVFFRPRPEPWCVWLCGTGLSPSKKKKNAYPYAYYDPPFL